MVEIIIKILPIIIVLGDAYVLEITIIQTPINIIIFDIISFTPYGVLSIILLKILDNIGYNKNIGNEIDMGNNLNPNNDVII